ncbi:MAG: hypothetical protein ACOX6Z_03260 [Dethiobacteria bacterium]|jgi:hypothetical protein
MTGSEIVEEIAEPAGKKTNQYFAAGLIPNCLELQALLCRKTATCILTFAKRAGSQPGLNCILAA